MRKGIAISCIIICISFVFANSPRSENHEPLPMTIELLKKSLN